MDQRRHGAAVRLDTQRQRRDVEQQDVIDLPRQRPRLDSRAKGDDLVRIDFTAGFLAEQAAHERLHGRHARLTADEDHGVDLVRSHLSVGHGALARRGRGLDEVSHDLLQRRARQRRRQVQGAGRARGDEGQVDRRLQGRGEFDLGALSRLFESLQSHAIGAQVDAVLLGEAVGQPRDDTLVKVVAAKARVAVGAFHLEDAIT